MLVFAIRKKRGEGLSSKKEKQAKKSNKLPKAQHPSLKKYTKVLMLSSKTNSSFKNQNIFSKHQKLFKKKCHCVRFTCCLIWLVSFSYLY